MNAAMIVSVTKRGHVMDRSVSPFVPGAALTFPCVVVSVDVFGGRLTSRR